jgi:DNA-binding YbaB/EbfC family protein
MPDVKEANTGAAAPHDQTGVSMAGMNMQEMMKQARKMQEQLAQAQESMKDVTIDASAGGGMVKATVNGDLELVSIQIDPDALDPEDVDLLQDMIVAAVNEAIRGVSEVASKQMSSITGGLNIPGMPF